MKISEAQKIVDDWINSTGVRYFNELTNMSVLMEEVGELARIFSRSFGEQSYKRKEDELLAQDKMKEEMADILFVLICLANQTGINLTEAFLSAMEKRNSRDKNRHLNNPKLQK